MKLTKKVMYGIGLLAITHSVFAGNPLPAPNKVYFGIFGGGGSSNDFDVDQYGTAYFIEASGGPLAVNATGELGSESTSLFGIQFGYQAPSIMLGSTGSWLLSPAVELEGYYMNKKSFSGNVIDNNSRVDEHEFAVTYPMKRTVFLTNLIFNINYPRLMVTPYVGLGIGGAILDISGANSKQVNPLEAGVNHYNNNPDASDTTFAGQVKAGLSYNFTSMISIFAEYRWLYISNTDFTFGSTNYPDHAATSSWTVDMDPQKYNLGSAGIRLSI